MCDSIFDGVFMEIVCKNTIGKVVKCTKRRRTGDDEDFNFVERRTVLDHLKELRPMGYVLTKKDINEQHRLLNLLHIGAVDDVNMTGHGKRRRVFHRVAEDLNSMWTGEPILINSIEDRVISVVHLKADGSVHSMRVLCAFQRFLSRLRLPLGMQVVYETGLGTVSTNSGDCAFDFKDVCLKLIMGECQYKLICFFNRAVDNDSRTNNLNQIDFDLDVSAIAIVKDGRPHGCVPVLELLAAVGAHKDPKKRVKRIGKQALSYLQSVFERLTLECYDECVQFYFAMGFRCYAVPGVLDETTARRYNIKLNKLRRGEIFTRNGATKCIPMYWPAED
jgi:hypothetical protein